MRTLTAGIFLVLALPAAHANAKAIDLSKVYGDKFGCINRNGQEVVAEKMLLLKEGNLVMAYSACEIRKTTANKDGSVILQAHCDAEGEESDTSFSIVSSKKNKGSFVIYDEDRNRLGEVALCRK